MQALFKSQQEEVADLRDKLSRFVTKGAPLSGNTRPGSASTPTKSLSREERRRKLVETLTKRKKTYLSQTPKGDNTTLMGERLISVSV